MLFSLINDPNNLPAEGGFNFAKKYVHDYTEYSDFHIITFSDFMALKVEKFSQNEIDIAFKLLCGPKDIR